MMASHSNASRGRKVPQRPFGRSCGNKRLPETVSIVGVGCSSFSTFFWSADDFDEGSANDLENRNHPRVREWIELVKVAVVEYDINVLDTAPWYGHGTSEVVLGWAVEEMEKMGVSRSSLMVNTKVGRYEADPKQQFDFSRSTTLESVKRSLRRLNVTYIDVLQLHDPEFALSIRQLLEETIPTMVQCQKKGWCRALGMTGYPLEVQREVIVRSTEQGAVWDQSLVYSHFNLHDTSLVSQPVFNDKSFADFCSDNSIALLAAAPLSMGLLTNSEPQEWHPSSDDLKLACREAARLCEAQGVNISTLATVFAMSNPRIPCTILGMKNVQELRAAVSAATRFSGIKDEMQQEEMLKVVFSKKEYEVYLLLRDPFKGPFASVWANGNYKWDGIEEARKFWRAVTKECD